MQAYLRDKVASYGGELSYSIAWNKVDASRGDEETTAGVSTGLEETFDVILKVELVLCFIKIQILKIIVILRETNSSSDGRSHLPVIIVSPSASTALK